MWLDELTVVGAALRSEALFTELRALLPTGDVFGEPECGRVWTAMKVAQDRKQFDLAYVKSLLSDDHNALGAVNEAASLKALADMEGQARQYAAKLAGNQAPPAPLTEVGRGGADSPAHKGGSVSSFNQVTIMGNLTADPELRATPSGSPVANVSVALNEKWTDKNGTTQERVTFVEVVLWGKTAENVCRWKKKGEPVLIAGKLQQERWQEKETGKNRDKLRVVAESVTFLGKA